MIDSAGRKRELLDLGRWSESGRFSKHVYVSALMGNAVNSGLTPEEPVFSINAAIALCTHGDILHIGRGTYDEAVSIPAGNIGLKVICEPGVYLVNTTPGTVVAIASDCVYWEGGIIETNGQIGMAINAEWFTGKGIHVYNCTIGFDLNAEYPVLIDCITNETATSGFDIAEDSGYFINCHVHGAAASRGFYLSNANADNNNFIGCSTLGCTAGGFETVAGADGNLFDHCSQSSLCAGPTDAGANNTWASHSQDSQITAGNTLQEDLSAIHVFLSQALHTMEFWSLPEDMIDIDNVATDIALPDVVVDALPTGATIVKAIAIFKFRMIEETSGGANALDGAQEIQVRDDTPSAWVDAINFIADQFTLAASAREGGDVCIGAIDISGTVDGNDTYNFQWDEALADADDISIYDIQVGIKIWFR